MSITNRLPELEKDLTSDDRTLYYLQKIVKYDDGNSYSDTIGIWDSPDGDIDKTARDIIRRAREFCKYNKFVKPHTLTIRKVKATISSEVIESQSEHYGISHKLKHHVCENCHGCINYGDDVVVKKTDTGNNYFCCSDCLAEYENAIKYSSDNDEYNELFVES